MEASAKEKKTQSAAVTTNNVGTNNAAYNATRRKRVRRLKKMIIGSILAAIVIPIIGCVILSVKVFSLKTQLREAQSARDAFLENMAQENSSFNNEEVLQTESSETEDEQEAVFSETSTKKVYLTFDDGPSDNTLKILEILDRYGVKATFFVTGEEADTHPERYQAIVNGGHTLGMHSYSHKYSEIYASLDNFGSDLLKLQEFLEKTTQVTPQFYRFPGGSSNTVSSEPMSVFCDYLTDNGITYMDWNVSSKDASSPMRSVDEIVQNCTADLERFDTAVILLHDAVNKSSTVEALPEVIEKIQAMENTEILPVTEETVVIHHKQIENGG